MSAPAANREQVIDDQLEKIGLMVQQERPLHEGTLWYLDDRSARGKEILRWWSDLGHDPVFEGRGSKKAVYKEARLLLETLAANGTEATP